MSYLPCELHCHTVHSDGKFLVGELQQAARDNGLSAIALTDHNTMSGHNELDDSIIPTVRGIEWTTYFGHMLVLGARSFVDWRDAVPDNIDEKIKQVNAVGGIVGIGHPFQIGSPVCTGGRWEFNIKDYSAVSYVEVWHENFETAKSENVRALDFWTQLLDKGCKIPATYGRDWHSNDRKGVFGCTYLDLEEMSASGVTTAIKKGRTVVSWGAGFSFTLIREGELYHIGDTVKRGSVRLLFSTDTAARPFGSDDYNVEYSQIRLVSNGGEIVECMACDNTQMELELEPSRWYRAELWGSVNDEEVLLAFTSPVYCK